MSEKHTQLSEETVTSTQLPVHGMQRIIGTGGFSTAYRICNGEMRYIAVLRKWDGETSSRYKAQQEFHRLMPDYTQNIRIIKVDGPNGVPYSLKISREIDGSTLYDNKILMNLGSRRVRRELIRFALRTLEIKRNNNIFPDLWGRQCRSLTEKFQIALSPFTTNNIVSSDSDQTISLVDSEPILADYHTSGVKNFLRNSLQQSALIAWTLAAAGIDIIDTSLRMQPTKREKINSEEFIKGLKQVVNILEASGIRYIVLGSVAQAAIMETHGSEHTLSTHRSDGSKRDIDIVILDRHTENVTQLLDHISSISQRYPDLPPVSVVVAVTTEDGKA